MSVFMGAKNGKYPIDLTSRGVAGDWALVDATVCTAGVQTLLGKYTVKAGMIVQIGNGYAYAKLATSAPATFYGTLLVFVQNSTGSRKHLVAKFHTSVTTDEGDKNKMKWLDPAMFAAQKDTDLRVEFIADATATMSLANSIVRIPAIVYDVA